MKERSAILSLYASMRDSGEAGVLATVVHTAGSTYRRPGARMLLASSGTSAGLISGGCLETDLRERFPRVLRTGEAELVTYDSTSSADIVWGLGLGCSGIASILLERVGGGAPSAVIEFLGDCALLGSGGAIATVYAVRGIAGVRPGDRLMMRDGADPAGAIADPGLGSRMNETGRAALEGREGQSFRHASSAGEAAVFVEFVTPPISLLVFGAGPDAIPLARIAKELGWHVRIVDGRSAHLTRANFPSADELLLVHPDETARTIRVPHNAVAVVMTHNFNHDVHIVRYLLSSPARYIGLLGPRSKTHLLLDRLKADGIVPPAEEDLQRLHNPVGLDIGAEAPEEIALAITAEILAVLRGHPGGALRLREGPMHP